jgi:hypothetical protein
MYRKLFLSDSFETSGRRRPSAATLLLLALSFSAVGVAHADTTSPGKNSVFVSSAGIPMPSLYSGPTLTGTIAKGRKGTVLAIEASISDGASYPTAAGMRVIGTLVRVNGITAQPNPSASYQYLVDCGYVDNDPVACSSTGTYWFDVDSAELANPGSFVGQPLVIEMLAGDVAEGPLIGVTPMDASLTVRVQKK